MIILGHVPDIPATKQNYLTTKKFAGDKHKIYGLNGRPRKDEYIKLVDSDGSHITRVANRDYDRVDGGYKLELTYGEIKYGKCKWGGVGRMDLFTYDPDHKDFLFEVQTSDSSGFWQMKETYTFSNEKLTWRKGEHW